MQDNNNLNTEKEVIRKLLKLIKQQEKKLMQREFWTPIKNKNNQKKFLLFSLKLARENIYQKFKKNHAGHPKINSFQPTNESSTRRGALDLMRCLRKLKNTLQSELMPTLSKKDKSHSSSTDESSGALQSLISQQETFFKNETFLHDCDAILNHGDIDSELRSELDKIIYPQDYNYSGRAHQ